MTRREGRARRSGAVVSAWTTALAGAALLAASACSDGFFFDPAPGDTGALAVRWAAALDGPGEAFDQADNLRIRLLVPGSRAPFLDEEILLDGPGTVFLPVELDGEPRTFELEAAVRIGALELFTASDEVTLRPGETTEVALQLQPVGHDLALPLPYPVLTAYGDTLVLGGAVVFATGDTIPGRTPDWSTEDPDVVEVGRLSDGGGYAVALADGTARLTATDGGLQGDATLEVRAEVHQVEVTPAVVELVVGDELQLSAAPLDRRGNAVPDRPTDWTSDDPTVASVDDTGLAHGEGTGKTRVNAQVEGVTGFADVTVILAAPEVETLPATGVGAGAARLNGSVNPRGSPTTAWFRWATDPDLANALQTAPQDVGSAQSDVVVDELVTDLPPSTTVYFQVVASNAGGTATGGVLAFQTPDPPSAPSDLELSVDGGVFVRWTDNSADETGFEVERAVGPLSSASGGPAAQQSDFELLAVVGADVEELVDEDPPTGVLTYRVRACSPDGCSAYTPPASITFVRPPAVTTESATDVGPNSARLVGTVNPQGAPTQAWFEVDDDPDLLSPLFTTSPQAVGSGSGDVVYDAFLDDLSSGRTYYFRAVASNQGGTAVGQVGAFTTPVPPAAPRNVEADYDEVGVGLFWDDVSTTEERFEIQRAVSGTGFQDLAVVQPNSTYYNDPNPPDGFLEYRIRACHATACSAYSDPAGISWPGQIQTP